MSSTPSFSLNILARVLPRTADMAFEARRHATQCEVYLERATHALAHLRSLLDEEAAPGDLRLIDVDAHMRVLEQKVRLYASTCATIESIEDALSLAKHSLDRLGASSTRVMVTLRQLFDASAAKACREVANELVFAYTRCTDRYSDLRVALTDAIPADFAARLARLR